MKISAFVKASVLSFLGATAFGATSAYAECASLPDHPTVRTALRAAVLQDNGGFGLDMWASIVDRDGEVCVVTFTGDDRGDQWPGSRVISTQKANTANAFSLPILALSTANLYAATQPGGSLFGLQFSNPVDTSVAYGNNPKISGDSNASKYGQSNDPMVGSILGGVNVFGGGLALYDGNGTLLGAIGVSGDSSCADHNIAWRVRDALGLDYVPSGVGAPADNIIFDIGEDGESVSGFGHPECGVGTSDADDNSAVVSACPPGNGATPGCI